MAFQNVQSRVGVGTDPPGQLGAEEQRKGLDSLAALRGSEKL